MVTLENFDIRDINKILHGITFEFAHVDDRRLLEECNRESDSWQRFNIFKGEVVLADHYHEGKNETFYFVEGSGIILLAHVDKNGVVIGDVERVFVQPGTIMTIPPYMAHQFVMEEGAYFVCYSTAPFDPNNKDLHPCKLTFDAGEE